MEKYIKLILFVCTFMIITSTQVSEIKAESSTIRILVNGVYKDNAEPIMKNNRVFVSTDFIEEALNCTVDYSSSSKTVYIKAEDMELTLPIDSNKYMQNRETVQYETSSFIENDIAFVPLRFIAESLNKEVQWDQEHHIALVGRYTGETYTEDTFLYTNEEYGYTMRFPNSWKEEAIMETKDGVLFVYDKKTVERFRQDGYMTCGPVFTIELNDYAITAQIPGQAYVLDYEDEKYLEASFVTDVQHYPETKDSYNKIYDEAEKALGSFRRLDRKR